MCFTVDSASRPKIGAFALRPVFDTKNRRFWYHFGSRNVKKRRPGEVGKTDPCLVAFYGRNKGQKIGPERPKRRQGSPGTTWRRGPAECARPQSYAPPGKGGKKGLSPGWVHETPGTRWGTANLDRFAKIAVPQGRSRRSITADNCLRPYWYFTYVCICKCIYIGLGVRRTSGTH